MSETLESVIIKDLIENLNLWAEKYSGKPISLTLFRAAAILGELERRRDEARKHLRDANKGAEINAHINQKFAQQLIDAREKIKNQAKRIRVLEGATNHACGTPLTRALRERDEAREVLNKIANASHFDNIGNWARNEAKKALEGVK